MRSRDSHYPSVSERRCLRPNSERVTQRLDVRIKLYGGPVEWRSSIDRQRASQDAARLDLMLRAFARVAQTTEDEDPASLLRKAVVRGVDYSPFDFITKVGQGRQHHGEVTASLRRW